MVIESKEVVQLTKEQHDLVKLHMPLARFLAHTRWLAAPDALDFEELVSLANQGLISAAQRFDPSYHKSPDANFDPTLAFAGFAKQRIVGAILDWQKRDADHVSRYYRTDYKILQRAGYPDKVRKHAELAAITGLDVERIRSVITAVELKPVSFHQLSNDDTEAVMSEPVAVQDTESSVLVSAISAAVADTISELPDIQQVILALRYFEHLELQAIAIELSTSITNVRDAHNAALVAVHSAMVDAAAS